MISPQFIHLRLHSEYSIQDGSVRIDAAVKRAAKDAQPALALTDLSNFYGLIKFYKSARKEGIKPIAGCDVLITNDQEKDKPFNLLLLVKNRQGYLQLCELISRAWLENQNKGRAEIRIEWLEALAKSENGIGLIALSGFREGDVGTFLAKDNFDEAEKRAKRWAQIFPDSFYIELQRTGKRGTEEIIQQSLILASRLELPVVATHPVQFLTPEDFQAHEVRVCIATKDYISNKNRAQLFNEKQYFLTQEEMFQLFEDIPEAIQNTVEIAKRCNLTFELGKAHLPDFPTPEGMSLSDFLAYEAKEGLKKRLIHLYPDEEKREKERPRYEERLNFEIETINNMGFAGYFLIVADFIRWAKQNGVPVGPGRGSGAGSLVAYSLLITDLDPLAYNLLFERFLNPERVSMPDFDIDFCQEGRDKVIQYVKDRYGHDAVSQIATFGTMAAKAAVRDVGRVLGQPYGFCDDIAKLIPFKPGVQVTIADARKEEPLLEQREKKEEEVGQLLAMAEQLEGLTRNIGMHAGGVLIAPGKLTDFCPLYTQNDDAGVVSHFDKKDVEEIGLVKFDFLGLTTLTILNLAVRYIRELYPEMANFSLDQIPIDDEPTYELLTKAKTVAVFQLESTGMQRMLKDAKPDRFEDIIALVALYRPGPMELIPDFCQRKHGAEFEYPDPRTEKILSETYGIMVYQEQVMQMAQIIGGYSLGGADLLRRAMGKKDPKEMARHRQIFRDGAVKNDLSEKKADEIFDLMEKFAGYGFNKSHAAAYAKLAYQTAYLKTHYPAAFMAANLSLAMDDVDKVRTFVNDSIEVCGLKILPPDINSSEYRFKPVMDGNNEIKAIQYGLGALKGSGEAAVEAIVKAREAGEPFKDLFDFCVRIDRKQVSRRTIDSLIKAGAFDCFNQDRAVLLATLPLAMEAAEQVGGFANQGSLLGDDSAILEDLEYVEVPHWTDKQKLTEEKDILGFCMSGHFFDSYKKDAELFGYTKLSELSTSRDTRKVMGVIASVRDTVTKQGKRMAVVTLDDGTGTAEVMIFSDILNHKDVRLEEGDFLMALSPIVKDHMNGRLRINAEAIYSITEARLNSYEYLRLRLSEEMSIKNLKEMLKPYVIENGVRLIADFKTRHMQSEFLMGDDWRVNPTDECLQVLRRYQ